MNQEELCRVLKQLEFGPYPTRQKKIYGTNSKTLLAELPSGFVREVLILPSLTKDELPEQEENKSAFILEKIEEQLKKWKDKTDSGVALLKESHLLARYRIPLTTFYNYVGDGHALIIWIEPPPQMNVAIPRYIKYDYASYMDYFHKSLANQLCLDEKAMEGSS